MIRHRLSPQHSDAILIVALHLIGAVVGLCIGWLHHG